MKDSLVQLTDAMETETKGTKGSPWHRPRAVAEVTLLVPAFYFLIKSLVLTPIPFIQFRLVGWDFFAHALMTVVPIALIKLRRQRLRDYGISLRQLREPEVIKLAVAASVILAAVWLVLAGTLLQVGGYQLSLNLPPMWFGENWQIPSAWKTLIGVTLTVLFEALFCGLGEEVMFRGYIQGRLNAAFGRPWQFRGTRIGWGLFLSAALFGFGHGLGFFNPFGEKDGWSHFTFAWQPAAITALQGLIFGWVRDHTEGIAAPAILHALIGLFYGIIIFS
jgi:hypothetical protein